MTATMNRRLVLEERAAAPDGAGGMEEIWEERGAHWAALAPASSREIMAGGRPASFVSHKALIRHAPFGAPERPMPDQRFREDERIFAIRAVSEADDRREMLICWLEEGALT